MIIKKISLVLPVVVALSACVPPTVGNSVNGWPRTDQALSGQNLVEIERHLRGLGIFRGRVDGQITQITRNSIARYQRSIGAPATGVVSARLLRSLRSSVANIRPTRTTVRTTTRRPAATTTRVRPTTPTTTAPAATTTPSFEGGGGDGGDGGGGSDGGGGDDGGSWG